jgi:hypothetical protein
MNPGEKYVALAPLTTALNDAGVSCNEAFVAALLAAGAPHVTRRHRLLAQPSRVLVWWRAHPGFTPAAGADTAAAPADEDDTLP